MMDRIVTLVDMDCFYCQVEARLNPSLNGKPLAVVQYNKWKGGGIIAVNYEARDFGVTRSMRGDEARKKCPDIVLVHVPEVRGKADLTKYRDAGREVIDVFCQFSDCVQRASVDEAYIDVTRAVEQRISSLDQVQSSQLAATFVVGFSDIDSNDEEARHQGLTAWLESVYEMQDQAQLRLAVAGVIVEEMRAAVFQQTGFRCSAGIAHNKILGKLACGLHKPNRQTVLPQAGVTELYKTLPIRKVRNLGGKFGSVVVEQLGCKVMADLLRFTESQLQQKFDEKTGTWLYNITRGIDHDPVTQRLVSKSVGCCKKFPGRQALATRTDVNFWLSELSAEVAERLTKDLEENKRQAKLLTVSYHQDIESRGEMSSSRSGPLTSYDPQRIAADAFELVKKSNTDSASGSDLWYPPLKFLGLSAGKFVDGGEAQNSTIHDFFKAAKKGTEVNEEGHENVMDLNKVANENINGTNILNIRQEYKHGHSKSLADHKNRCEADSTRFMVNGASKTSSTSNSFFMKYLKQHNAKKSVELFSGKVSIDKPINNADSDDDMFESPTDKEKRMEEILNLNSGIKVTELDLGPSTSVTDGEKMKEVKLNLNSGTKVTKLNLGPSTSVIKTEPDENASELWVSVRELFPDLSKVDYGVVALLPVPLQERLQARIEKAKQDPSIRNRHYFNSPMTSDDSDLIEADQQQGTEVVHVECDMRNESNIMNPSHQFDDQYDGNFLSKSRCVLQHTVEEDSDLVEIYDDVAVHLEAGQKYLSASRVSMSNGDEGLVVSEKDASHTHVTGGAGGSDPKTSQCVVTEMCPQCGKDILLSEYLEHLDFHAAEKLHKELNKEVEHVRTVVKASTPHKNPSLELPTRRKRGQSSKKSSVTDRDKKMRSITAYFTAK